MSHSRYVRYKLNHFICSHKNRIMRSSQLSWKILRKLLNQNHILIYDHLYLKNIMIWLMFLRDNMLMSCPHIRRDMILKLNWNQERSQTSDPCTACHKKSCKCYNNILMSILQKNSYNQVVLHLCFQYYLWKNWAENYDFALIIKLWMWSWFKIDI